MRPQRDLNGKEEGRKRFYTTSWPIRGMALMWIDLIILEGDCDLCSLLLTRALNFSFLLTIHFHFFLISIILFFTSSYPIYSYLSHILFLVCVLWNLGSRDCHLLGLKVCFDDTRLMEFARYERREERGVISEE